MNPIIAVLNFVGNLFKFFKKGDRNELKESTRNFYQLKISNESRKTLTLDNEWRELKKFHPRLKVNPRIEPRDLTKVQEKYKIPFNWVIQLSNLGLIGKDENGEVMLLPTSKRKALGNAGLCLLAAGCCMAMGLWALITSPGYSSWFIYSWVVFICGTVTFVLMTGLNHLSGMLNANYYYREAEKHDKDRK